MKNSVQYSQHTNILTASKGSEATGAQGINPRQYVDLIDTLRRASRFTLGASVQGNNFGSAFKQRTFALAPTCTLSCGVSIETENFYRTLAYQPKE